MPRRECPSPEEIVGQALGALDPDRERALAEHVERCERCRAELERLAPAVGVLAESVDQLEPPPRLRRRLLAAVREEEKRREARQRTHPGDRLRAFLWRPAAAVGAAALFAAGATGYLLRDEGGEEASASYGLDSRLPGAAGAIEVEGDAAMLRTEGMPALERGEVYQVWVADGGGPRASATFVPHEDGSATAAVPEVAAGEARAVMVTEEPRPGSTSPHHPVLLSARIE